MVGFSSSSDRLASHVSSVFSYFTSYLTLAPLLTALWPPPPTLALSVKFQCAGDRGCMYNQSDSPLRLCICVCEYVCAFSKDVCGLLMHTVLLLKVSVILRIVYSGKNTEVMTGQMSLCASLYQCHR